MKSKIFKFSLLGCALLAFIGNSAKSAPDELQFQLNEARAQLEAMRQRYTSKPPASPAPRVANTPAAVARGYEIISDDELLAQLRDRPLLVVKKANGTREFVVLENE